MDAHLQLAPGSLQATATCADAEVATRLLKAWRDWQDARRCDPDAKPTSQPWTWGQIAAAPPGRLEDLRSRLVWRRCVQAVRVKQAGASVQWTLDLAKYPLVDLVRLFCASPILILSDW